MMMYERRRVLMTGGGLYRVFKEGIARINGEITRSYGLNVGNRIRVEAGGYLSVKMDFTPYKTLNFELSLAFDTETNGLKFGWGNSDTTYFANGLKDTAETSIKSVNISNVSGERYINIENAGVVGNYGAFIHNIWLGV